VSPPFPIFKARYAFALARVAFRLSSFRQKDGVFRLHAKNGISEKSNFWALIGEIERFMAFLHLRLVSDFQKYF